MTDIRPAPIPARSLLLPYGEGAGFADCYSTELPAQISFPQFVAAFYTTPLFKLERTLLRWFASRPATDADARHLAEGRGDHFAAWHVERRTSNQLLLADFTGRTRSWLMTEPIPMPGGAAGTRLYFGSAVVPRRHAGNKRDSLGFPFHALLGFHKLYSRLLLRSARSSLARSSRQTAP